VIGCGRGNLAIEPDFNGLARFLDAVGMPK
jgi:hypothetical protein